MALFCLVATLCGCMVSKGQLNTCRTQNRALAEKNAALQSEVENLRAHRDRLVQQLQQTEEELVLLRQENQLVRQRLELKQKASSRGELPDAACLGLLPAQDRLRLQELAKRFPSVGLNPTTGQCQGLSQPLSLSAKGQFPPEAETKLASLVQLLQSPEGNQLRVWIVAELLPAVSEGKTATNSSDRSAEFSDHSAFILKEKLCQMGLARSRIGIASVPAPNVSETSSTQGPGLKIFLLPPQVPIVGWTSSGSRLY